MKNRLILALGLCIGLSLTTFAQDPGAHFGVRLGVSSTNYFGPDLDTLETFRTEDGIENKEASVSSRLGIVGGVYFNLELSEKFMIKHELYFTSKGALVEYESGARFERFRGVIQVFPFMPTYQNSGWQVFGGPYVATTFIRNDRYIDPNGEELVLDDLVDENFLDYGGVIGVEYEFKHGLNLGARYFAGFAPANADGDKELYNRGLFLTAGFTFGKSEYFLYR